MAAPDLQQHVSGLEWLVFTSFGLQIVENIPGNVLLQPVEYHLLQAHGRWLLFDVTALTVLPSGPLDRTILELSSKSTTAQLLTEKVEAMSVDQQDVADRLETLIKHRFLLPAGKKPHPAKLSVESKYVTFMVNVSQRCNLTCPYCYVNQGFFDYKEKPIPRMEARTASQIVEKIFEFFPNFETYAYHFYGGEPLLNFEAIQRIVATAEAKAKVTKTCAEYHVTTNGTLLTRKIADFMDEHHFTIYLSIDGDEENHDRLRKYASGNGSFHDLARNLAYLRTRLGVHLIGSSVIRKGFSLSKAIQLLETYGVQQCKAERVRLSEENDLCLLGDEHNAYIKDIEGLIDHYIQYLSAGLKPMDFRLSSKILQLLTKNRRSFFCPAGERKIGISANGEIYPCALHVGRPQSKLGDIWGGIDQGTQRAFRVKFSPEKQKDCRNCWTRNLCGGGCSAMVDRFGHEDCRSLQAESEAAMVIYQYFAERDPVQLYGLVSPKIIKWVNGELDDVGKLTIAEPETMQASHNCLRGRCQ